MSKSGFTLVEVVVALTLLAAVSGVTMYSFNTSTRFTRDDKGTEYNIARGLMEQLAEYVRQDQWTLANVPLSGQDAAGVLPAGYVSPKVLNGRTLTTSYRVNDMNNDGTGADVARIDNDAGTAEFGFDDYRKVTVRVVTT